MAMPAPFISPSDPAAVRAAAERINRDVGLLLQSPRLAVTEAEHAALLTAAAVAGEVQDGDRSA